MGDRRLTRVVKPRKGHPAKEGATSTPRTGRSKIATSAVMLSDHAQRRNLRLHTGPQNMNGLLAYVEILLDWEAGQESERFDSTFSDCENTISTTSVGTAEK